MAGGIRDPRTSVTSRVLAILGAFDVDHPTLTLTDIARRTGLPLATAHRLVGELVAWRALSRGPDGGYTVGVRLWEVGLLSPLHARLREVALPYLQDLHSAVRENVHLAVRDGDEALYVEKVTGHRAVPIISRVGGRLPLHATGVGKALLAFASAAYIAAFLRGPLPRCTSYTITEPGRLARELATVRRHGWAATSEEMTLGSCSVAVPVLDTEGTAVASIGVVVHSLGAHLERLVPALRGVADQVAARLTTTAEDPYPGLRHGVAPHRPPAHRASA
ncbi:transcriptional regulator, IclR family [Micromonospora rhizosphaerae]|uniref:Transcriptional regulator, IclR family n=1 Tax=Micromonospora rhizosphaerae TaxID=568872 RepID=A0A1C6SWB1_9ACTN|nr:IclR family transcriptional regulator [Micromonospora rhizosphaerae]SCL33788.1 transcriptional regulator, IclR family [Micromonospora rhizosphaerae]